MLIDPGLNCTTSSTQSKPHVHLPLGPKSTFPEPKLCYNKECLFKATTCAHGLASLLATSPPFLLICRSRHIRLTNVCAKKKNSPTTSCCPDSSFASSSAYIYVYFASPFARATPMRDFALTRQHPSTILTMVTPIDKSPHQASLVISWKIHLSTTAPP